MQNPIISIINKLRQDFINHLVEYNLDQVSLDLMSIDIEEEFGERIQSAFDYFYPDRMDYYIGEIETIIKDIFLIEEKFIELEEYEKCSVLRDYRITVETLIKN